MIRDVDDESLGIRLHDVNRERAIERSMERVRHGLHSDWFYLTGDDHMNLRWVLGELWAITDRDEWDQLHFGKLRLNEVRRLVSAGDRLRRHGASATGVLQDAADMVRLAEMRVDSLGAEAGILQ